MKVRCATAEHIMEVVDVHKSAFCGFFLTELGDNFLKLYYKSVLKSKLGILLVCLEDDKVIGFCAACTKSKDFNSKLIKEDFCKYVFEAIRLFCTKPKALMRLYNNLSKTGQVEDNGDYGELLSIGVNRNTQSKGVGQKLMFELEITMKASGVKYLSLTTDAYNNENALKFYRKSGFMPMYEFISYPSRLMCRLIKELTI